VAYPAPERTTNGLLLMIGAGTASNAEPR